MLQLGEATHVALKTLGREPETDSSKPLKAQIPPCPLRIRDKYNCTPSLLPFTHGSRETWRSSRELPSKSDQYSRLGTSRPAPQPATLSSKIEKDKRASHDGRPRRGENTVAQSRDSRQGKWPVWAVFPPDQTDRHFAELVRRLRSDPPRPAHSPFSFSPRIHARDTRAVPSGRLGGEGPRNQVALARGGRGKEVERGDWPTDGLTTERAIPRAARWAWSAPCSLTALRLRSWVPRSHRSPVAFPLGGEGSNFGAFVSYIRPLSRLADSRESAGLSSRPRNLQSAEASACRLTPTNRPTGQ